ncbi:MAG: 2-dehydropantoate 2-reductase N-terminal domain-containing protein [Ilumatobacteraceae bacterium]
MIVIFGAGGVGSVIGGRLHQHRDRHGHEIVMVARPTHAAAIRSDGLRLHSPAGVDVIAVPVVEHISEITLTDGDIVILTMKTQDTTIALDQLQHHTTADIAVVCAQNGVENERLVLRRFARTYGICVILPALFLDPGVVDAFGAPHNAILDVGCYPTGADDTATALAVALTASDLVSDAVAEVMPIKYTKLLMNLANPIDALFEPSDASKQLGKLARTEAHAAFTAAGIVTSGGDVDAERRAGRMEVQPVAGRQRGGGSTWQGLARGATTTETDYLNGEIVLLGRLHRVPTPVNAALCSTMRWAAESGIAPRSLDANDLMARIGHL